MLGGDIKYTASYSADTDGLNVKRTIQNKLLIAGMRPAGIQNYYLYSISSPGDNKVLDVYPFASHMDNFMQPHPTYDINWGLPIGIYFTGGTDSFPSLTTDSDWDENCLYSNYWKRYIEQITDPNSKIVTAWIKLSTLDIYNLDFTIPVRIADMTLRINKIIDWDINSDGVCKVEFITIN